MGLLHDFKLYRHSRGFGIHSPFAFSFVCNVLCERLPYYAYGYLRDVRQAVLESAPKGRHRVISLKSAKLLFRITNRFAPKQLLQVGTNYGVSAASMMSVSAQSRLWLYEPHLEKCPEVAQVLEPFLDYIDCYNELPAAIADYSTATRESGTDPYVLVNSVGSDGDSSRLADYLKTVLGGSGVVILRNLERDSAMACLWQQCRAAMTHGHTYTNGKMAVIVATAKLPLQHFELRF